MMAFQNNVERLLGFQMSRNCHTEEEDLPGHGFLLKDRKGLFKVGAAATVATTAGIF